MGRIKTRKYIYILNTMSYVCLCDTGWQRDIHIYVYNAGWLRIELNTELYSVSIMWLRYENFIEILYIYFFK